MVISNFKKFYIFRKHSIRVSYIYRMCEDKNMTISIYISLNIYYFLVLGTFKQLSSSF